MTYVWQNSLKATAMGFASSPCAAAGQSCRHGSSVSPSVKTVFSEIIKRDKAKFYWMVSSSIYIDNILSVTFLCLALFYATAQLSYCSGTDVGHRPSFVLCKNRILEYHQANKKKFMEMYPRYPDCFFFSTTILHFGYFKFLWFIYLSTERT